jgi:hypothetical protein
VKLILKGVFFLMVNFFNILDDAAAEQLQKNGFHCLSKKTLDKKTVYVFAGTFDFVKHFNANFTQVEHFVTERLDFSA